MPNLRMLGLVIGILGLLITFLTHRGIKWKRSSFVMLSLINAALIIVSIAPNSVNILRDMLSLHETQYGRLFSLIILATIFLLFFSIYTKTKLNNLEIQFDTLIRKFGAGQLENSIDLREKIKPIMVIIPAYNEAENLKKLLPRIPTMIDGAGIGVLVIDDGSSDGTSDVVRNEGYLVVSNIINRGQGSASRLGYDILIKYGVFIGITMDADNQHRPEDIADLIAPIKDGRYDLVIGSRVLGNHEKMSWFRNFGITLFSKIISIVTGQRLTDSSSGYKAFNINRLKDIRLTENQFQSAEVLIESCKKGLKIGEVPIIITRRAHGKSKKGKDWVYGFNFAKTILKTWWRQ